MGPRGSATNTIPEINPFAGDGDAETARRDLRLRFSNAHRLSWDLTDGTMFAMDIGMNQIEEVNIVHAGRNYGLDGGGKATGKTASTARRRTQSALRAAGGCFGGRTEDEYTYPVAMYDHNEGRAISGGFAYHGRIEALRGKFVFGDLVRGRLFAATLQP